MIILTTVFAILFLMLIEYLFFRSVTFKRSWLKFYAIPLFLVLVAALFLLDKSIHELEQFGKRAYWQSVNGVIISARVVGEKTRQPEIEYSYIVDPDTFISKNNLGIAMFASNKSQDKTARTIIANYHEGDSIKVYFNPQNPSETVLKKVPDWSVFMQYSFAVVIFSLALTILFTLIRNLLKPGVQ
jgi:hypothetical protein